MHDTGVVSRWRDPKMGARHTTPAHLKACPKHNNVIRFVHSGGVRVFLSHKHSRYPEGRDKISAQTASGHEWSHVIMLPYLP